MSGSHSIEELHRGDVWYVKIWPGSGGSLSKIVPCVVLQIDEMNRSGALATAIVIPLDLHISEDEKISDYDIIFEPDETGLPKRSRAIWTQVRAASASRLVNRSGHVEGKKLDRLARHVGSLIGLSIEP